MKKLIIATVLLTAWFAMLSCLPVHSFRIGDIVTMSDTEYVVTANGLYKIEDLDNN